MNALLIPLATGRFAAPWTQKTASPRRDVEAKQNEHAGRVNRRAGGLVNVLRKY
jgi:hypothetical protein